MVQESISQYIRRKRRELGLSQEDLADKSGISWNYVAKLETGKREPGLKVLKRLAEALEVPKEEIVNVLLGSWPYVENIEPCTEFLEFPPNMQNLLVEVGYLMQKYGKF